MLAWAVAAPPLLEAVAVAAAVVPGVHSIQAAPGKEVDGWALRHAQGVATMQKKPAAINVGQVELGLLSLTVVQRWRGELALRGMIACR